MRPLGVFIGTALILAGCSSSSPPGTTATGTSAGTGTSGTTGAATSGGTTGATSSSGAGTTSGSLGVGAACNPSAMVDACAATGYACEAPNYVQNVEDGGAGGNCAVPTELQSCDTNVGCDGAGLTCTAIEGGTSDCVRACGTDADCPIAFTACLAYGAQGQKVCEFNFCVSPPIVSQPGSYFASCSASQSGQGTCVPVANDQYGTVGVCLESGSVAAVGACSALRDAGSAAECGVGQACDGLLIGQISGFCQPICSFGSDAGPACGAGSVCANSQSFGVPTDLEWGICAPTCSVGGTCAEGTCVPVSATAVGSPGLCF